MTGTADCPAEKRLRPPMRAASTVHHEKVQKHVTDDTQSTWRRAFLFWGTMDAVQILVYVLAALHQGRIPYVDDVSESRMVLESYGDVALLMLVPSWTLQAGLFLSCALLLRGNRFGVYVALAQVPLRLVTLMPSVPFALVLVRPLDIAPSLLWVLYGGLLLLIEGLKFRTLRKAGPVRSST